MLHELWDDPQDEGRYTFGVAGPRGDGDQARSMLSPAARLTWTVEADSHFEAMTLYYEHMGWGMYTTDQEWDRRTYAEQGWDVPQHGLIGPHRIASVGDHWQRARHDLLRVPHHHRLRQCLRALGVVEAASRLCRPR